MYDNLPFYTHHVPTIEAFLNSNLLEFIKEDYIYFPIDHVRAGEIKCRKTIHKYFNLTIVVKYNAENELIQLYSKGSFHYLINEGVHNANFIGLKEAQRFLIDFSCKFNIDLKNLILRPSEFAQMIVIPFDIEEIIRNTFCETRKMFVRNGNYSTSKISGKTTNNQRLKVYSKYHEHRAHCAPNTLRLELKFIRARFLRDRNINTMADLLNHQSWLVIREKHIEVFRQIIIFDSTIKLPRNSGYKSELVELSNQNDWEKLIEECKSEDEYDTKYNAKVATLRMLSKNYGSNVYEVLMKLLEKQWFKFLGRCSESNYKLERFSKHAQLSNSKHAPFIVCNPSIYFQKSAIKLCPITGYDITMQKPKSKLLSNTGLKHLEKTNIREFEKLRSILLTGNSNKFETDLYSMMSKQIRNRYYGRNLPRNQGSFF